MADLKPSNFELNDGRGEPVRITLPMAVIPSASEIGLSLQNRALMKPLFLVFLLSVSATLQATNVDREQRWIDQTVDSIFDGEPVYLDAEGHRFLSIYMESETQSSDGMIVIHGTGFHPNWDQVVRPVRVEMTTQGWNTLSIQMPILERSAQYKDYVDLYPEVPARIQAAVAFLTSKGISRIVIVAHSQGATMACYYLAGSNHSISALVAVGMSTLHTQLEYNSAVLLESINIPILDIYGSKDFPSVLASVDRRANGAAHNSDYQQLVIENAYHFFDDHESELMDALVEWLNTAPLKSYPESQ